jgi:hypothetical protein
MYCRSPRIRLAALTGRGGRWSVALTGRGGRWSVALTGRGGRWSIACPPWANGRGGRRSVTAVPTGAQRLSQPVRNGCPNRSSSSFQTFHVNGEEPCEDGWEQAGFNTFKRVPERPVTAEGGSDSRGASCSRVYCGRIAGYRGTHSGRDGTVHTSHSQFTVTE